ncbi:MAG: LuxR C-terminal-related transcriptional regulator, partial [Woeseiaceae bacterium]|nr:LuxR C-terminal-related transcriptional regulator [Woeseiaceae bacterium]
ERPADRYQLFDAVSRFLFRAARRQLLLILFDNLQFADRSSLVLLEHFCLQLAGQPVTVIAAFRDSDLDRIHPLRRSLDVLSRSAGAVRVSLNGLSRGEVAELLQIQIGYRPPASFVDGVHERSDGNPLFVVEVGEMLLRHNPDVSLTRAGFHFRVPDSLRDVIAGRLDELPKQTSALLGVAAVLGRDFDLAALADLAGQSEQATARALEPAEAASIVTPTAANHYVFAHALYREVLYAEHSTIQRANLHRKAAELLEQRLLAGADDCLAKVAYHFFESAQAGTERKSIAYCRQAAEAASRQRAYGEAVALLDCALQVAAVSSTTNDREQFELLRQAGRAQYQAGELSDATSTVMKAAIFAYQHGWWDELAHTLFFFQLICQQSGYRHISSVPLHTEVLDNIDAANVELRAKTLASLAMAYRTAGKPREAAETFREGVGLARSCNDPELLLECLTKGNWSVGRMPENVREGLEVSREALVLATELGHRDAMLDALVDIIFQLCDLGEIDEVENQLRRLRDIADKERQPHFKNIVRGFETATAILKGEWAEARRSAQEGLRRQPMQGVFGLRGRFGFQMFAIQKAQGLLGDVQDVAERIIAQGRGTRLWIPGQILLHCELGQLPQARRALQTLGDIRQLPRDDLYLTALIFLSEACHVLGDVPRCRLLYESLLPYRELNATLPGTLMLGAVAGYLAPLAFTIGQADEARQLFAEGIALNRAMHARPALARVQIDFARILAASGVESEHARARQLLADARRVAVELGLQPIIDRVDEVSGGSGFGELSKRETQVLRVLASGASNVQIADQLNISNSTVATHIRHIFRKTGVSNRTEAADLARRNGLLDAE